MADATTPPTPLPSGFVYDEPVGWAGSKYGDFHYSEPSLVVVDFAYDDKQEIGDYVALVPRDRLAAAHTLLVASRYVERARPETVPPETKFVSFMEEGAQAFSAFQLAHVPPEVLPAMDAMRGLVEWMRSHPSHTVRGSARWHKPHVSTRDALELSVQLESVGALAATLGNPLFSPEPKASLVLELTAQGGDPVRFQLTSAQHIVTKHAPEPETLDLPPKAMWGERFKKRVYLSPGRYAARVIYRSELEYTFGSTNVEGELPMSLAELVVEN